MAKKEFNIFYRTTAVRVLLLNVATATDPLVSIPTRTPLYGPGYNIHTDPYVLGHKTHIGNLYTAHVRGRPVVYYDTYIYDIMIYLYCPLIATLHDLLSI